MSKLLDFYSGIDTDHAGRKIEDIWNFTDEQLEHGHDYIQWLFPLEQSSMFLKVAPIATNEDFKAFFERPELVTAVRRSIALMRDFYGLDSRVGVMYDCFVPPVWFTPNNHNFKRLTRMFTFMSKVGHYRHAKMMHEGLINLTRHMPDVVSPRTLDFWEAALKTPEVDINE